MRYLSEITEGEKEVTSSIKVYILMDRVIYLTHYFPMELLNKLKNIL